MSMNNYDSVSKTYLDSSNLLQPETAEDIKNNPTYMSINQQDDVDSVGTVTVGTSATENIYFVDDTVKNYLSRDTNPVFLFASLSADRFAGSIVETPVSVLPVKITYSPSTKLQLSTNGISSFKLNTNMYLNSTYNINVALVNDYNNIIKTDYPELSLGDTQTVRDAFAVNFTLNNSAENLNLSKRTLNIETKGSGNFLVEPTTNLNDTGELLAQVYVSDPPYCPIDTLLHVLTNTYTPTAHFITPGYADASFAGGGRFETLSNNEFVADVNTTSLSASVSQNSLNSAGFAVCVDPVRACVYIGDDTNDTLLTFDRFMNPLNNGLPINLLDLICESEILNTSKFNFIDQKHPTTGKSILLETILGSQEDNVPHQFELSENETCERHNQNVDEKNSLSPSSICCDGNHDIWVTLIDGVMTVKLQPIGNTTHVVTAIAIPSAIDSRTQSQASLGLLNRTSSGEYNWMPSKVVADMNNDIWVSYTNQENIKLIKYNGAPVLSTTGEVSYPMSQIAELTFDKNTHLDDMVIDSSNNLWVADSTSLYTKTDADGEVVDQTHGRIYHISNDNRSRSNDNDRIIRTYTTYDKFDPVTGDASQVFFDKPSTMTFDLSDFLYVATAGNEIVRINPGTGESVHIFNAGDTYNETNTDRFNLMTARGEYTPIDAMSCDSDNSLLIVNNADRKLYTYRVPDNASEHPEHTDGSNYIHEWFSETGPRKFLQGSGDWTGIRWIQTYLKTVMGQRTLTATHNVTTLELSENEIYKINEDHDAGETLMSYTLQETINNKDNLLKWFMSTIVGDISESPDTLGKTVYEKISNFVANNNDVDLCNAKHLFSMAGELGVDIKSYDYTYPGSIQRLVDILSIKYKRLFGTRDATGLEFDKNGYANNFNHGRNLSKYPLATTDINDPTKIEYTVQVGTKLIAKEMYNGGYTVIEPMAIPGDSSDPAYDSLHGGLTSYPLSSYNQTWNWGLSHPDDESVFLYYDFYEYVPDSEPTLQLEGVINWSDQNNTISEQTTYGDWSKSEGVVESLFDKKIRIGIGVTNT